MDVEYIGKFQELLSEICQKCRKLVIENLSNNDIKLSEVTIKNLTVICKLCNLYTLDGKCILKQLIKFRKIDVLSDFHFNLILDELLLKLPFDERYEFVSTENEIVKGFNFSILAYHLLEHVAISERFRNTFLKNTLQITLDRTFKQNILMQLRTIRHLQQLKSSSTLTNGTHTFVPPEASLAEISPHDVTTLSSTRRPTRGLADSSPPDVTTSRSPAVSSSNYLSLKSIATPRDRGEVEYMTSSGLPAADLREAEGEVNGRGTTASGMTSSGRAVCKTTYGGCGLEESGIEPMVDDHKPTNNSDIQQRSYTKIINIILFELLESFKLGVLSLLMEEAHGFREEFVDYYEYIRRVCNDHLLFEQLIRMKFNLNLTLNEGLIIENCTLSRDVITFIGDYNKYSRRLSQSKWILGDSNKSLISIEECIGIPLMDICKSDNYKFMASGREDIDVRTIGKGRKFCIELYNATRDIFDIYHIIHILSNNTTTTTNNLKILSNKDPFTTVPLADPPEVQSNSSSTRRGGSSNYLSLKSKATPGDRGEVSETIYGSRGEVNREAATASGMTTSTGPQVEPVADLREAEGEVNREADGRIYPGGDAVCKTSARTPGATDDVVNIFGGQHNAYVNSLGVASLMDMSINYDKDTSVLLKKLTETVDNDGSHDSTQPSTIWLSPSILYFKHEKLLNLSSKFIKSTRSTILEHFYEDIKHDLISLSFNDMKISFNNKGERQRIQVEAEDKIKVYNCLVLSDEDVLSPCDVLMPLKIKQKNPLRTSHRRSQDIRERFIYDLKINILHPRIFIVNLTTQAGTYVKEFINGDMGRTQPSLKSLLNINDINVIYLDVVDFY